MYGENVAQLTGELERPRSSAALMRVCVFYARAPVYQHPREGSWSEKRRKRLMSALSLSFSYAGAKAAAAPLAKERASEST